MNERLDEAGRQDQSGFPPYPEIAPLPPLPSKEDRIKYGFKLVEEHGESLGDYLFAAARLSASVNEMVQWDMLGELIENEILGRPLQMSYNAADRLAAEGYDVEDDGADNADQSVIRPPNC